VSLAPAAGFATALLTPTGLTQVRARPRAPLLRPHLWAQQGHLKFTAGSTPFGSTAYSMRVGRRSHCFRLRGRSPLDRLLPSVARSSRTQVAAVRSYLKPGAALSASLSASTTR
jgi:hypothetical protein